MINNNSFYAFRHFAIPPPLSQSQHPLHRDLTTRKNSRIGISNNDTVGSSEKIKIGELTIKHRVAALSSKVFL